MDTLRQQQRSMRSAAPQVVPKRVEQAAVERLTVSFRVTDTRERLRLLKQFLVSNGYQYE